MSGGLKACCAVVKEHLPRLDNIESSDATRAAVKLISRYCAVSELTSRTFSKDKSFGVDGAIDVVNGVRCDRTGEFLVAEYGACAQALELLAALCKFSHSGERVGSRPLRILHALARAANRHAGRVDVIGNIATIVKRICKIPECRRTWLQDCGVACIARRLMYDCMLDIYSNSLYPGSKAYKEYKRAYRALCLLSQGLVSPAWDAGVRETAFAVASPPPKARATAVDDDADDDVDDVDDEIEEVEAKTESPNVDDADADEEDEGRSDSERQDDAAPLDASSQSVPSEGPAFDMLAYPELVSEVPAGTAIPFSVHVPAKEKPSCLAAGPVGAGVPLAEEVGGGPRGTMVCEQMLDRARVLVASGDSANDGSGPALAPHVCFLRSSTTSSAGVEADASEHSWLTFASGFPGGNLRSATCIARDDYDLILCEDRNDPARRVQWFYFEIGNAVPGRTYRFHIVNFGKRSSLYDRGCKVLMCHRPAEESGAPMEKWEHVGTSVCYYPSPYRELEVPSPPPRVDMEAGDEAMGDEAAASAAVDKEKPLKGKDKASASAMARAKPNGKAAAKQATSSAVPARLAAPPRRGSISSTPSAGPSASSSKLGAKQVRRKSLSAVAATVVAATKAKAAAPAPDPTPDADAEPSVGPGMFALTFQVRVPRRGTYRIASGFPYAHGDLLRDVADVLGPALPFNQPSVPSTPSSVLSPRDAVTVPMDGRPPLAPRSPSSPPRTKLAASLPSPRWSPDAVPCVAATEPGDEVHSHMDTSAPPSLDARSSGATADADTDDASLETTPVPRAPPGRPTIFRSSLCTSVMGRSVDLLTIADFSPGTPPVEERPVVVVTARVHPGESCASWVARGMLAWLAFDRDPLAERMRTLMVVKMVPMLNPDGVDLGSTRCSSVGDDLNRKWAEPSRIRHPCIYYVRRMLNGIVAAGRPLRVFLDLHGHSRREGAFLFGIDPPRKASGDDAKTGIARAPSPAHAMTPSNSERDLMASLNSSNSSLRTTLSDDGLPSCGAAHPSRTSETSDDADGTGASDPQLTEREAARLRVRALPAVFASRNDAVDLNLCSYKCGRGKGGCGRVVVAREVGVPMSYTLEVSHAGGGPGPLARRRHYQTGDLAALGADLLASVAECHARGLRLMLTTTGEETGTAGEDCDNEVTLLREVAAANDAAAAAAENVDGVEDEEDGGDA